MCGRVGTRRQPQALSRGNALAEKAQQQKAQALVVPPENAQEASLIEGLTIRSAANLRTLVEQLKGERPWPATGRSSIRSSTQPTKPAPWPCLDSSLASRALALSAAGGHHLLLVGPPAAARPAWPINCGDCCRP